MRNIYLIISSITIALLLSACGGGGGGTSEGGDTLTITIPACETYELLYDGDAVIKNEDNTSVKTVFNTDGTKKICVLSGSASILR